MKGQGYTLKEGNLCGEKDFFLSLLFIIPYVL